MRKKLTAEDIRSRVESRFPNFDVVSIDDDLAHITMRDRKCGYEWKIDRHKGLYDNVICPICGQKNKPHDKRLNHVNSYTTEDIKRRIFAQVGDEYTILSKYEGHDKKITLRHNPCGYVFSVRPDRFLGKRHSRCPRCMHGGTMDQDYCQSKIDERWGARVYTIVKYSGSSVGKSLIKKEVCGHEFKVPTSTLIHQPISPDYCPVCKQLRIADNKQAKIQKKFDAINERRRRLEETKIYDIRWDADNSLSGTLACKHCHNEEHLDHIRMSDVQKKCNHCNFNGKDTVRRFNSKRESFKDHIQALTDDYELLSEYRGCKEFVEVLHKPCGTKFSVRASQLSHRLQHGNICCPTCSPKAVSKTNEEFQQELDDRFGKGCYTVIGTYVNNVTPILVRHCCGYEYTTRPDHLVRGEKKSRYCPHCMPHEFSSGEDRISKYLLKEGVFFTSQYRIHECRDRRALPFDFAILDEENDPIGLIEFDGWHHKYAVPQWGGEENLKRVQKHDKIKTNYCKQHRIPLLRIPYNKLDTVEDIVADWLRNMNILSRAA